METSCGDDKWGLGTHFDDEFNFFANAKDGNSDYLADSWSHVSKFLKKKNNNRTTVEAKIKKLRTEKKASNDDEIKEDEQSWWRINVRFNSNQNFS